MDVNERWCTGKMNVGQLTDALKSVHTLTLHAIDTRFYSVATLMEDYQMEDLMHDKERLPHFRTNYGFQLPRLYGVTPKYSPRYRKLTEKDFDYHQEGGDYDERPPPLDYMPIEGRILLNAWKINDKEGYSIDLDHPQRGVSFDFIDHGHFSVQQPHHICNFLRALMKEKCVQIEPRWTSEGALAAQQPGWIQSDKVLDAITSYSSFEDQAGKLRLVCRQFDASALRQLEAKLNKTKNLPYTSKNVLRTIRALNVPPRLCTSYT